jgi:nicotinamidase-related amidase
MLNIEDSLLLIIDIQEKLVRACKDADTIGKKSSILAGTASILKLPTIVTEQYPQGLGGTVEELKAQFAEDTAFVEKTSFSALREAGFAEKIASYNRKQVILCGIETHICVYQTCLELLEAGYEVFVVKDASSSRKEFEHQTGLDLMKQAGAKLTCVEVVLFELLKGAKHPDFKAVQSLIK